VLEDFIEDWDRRWEGICRRGGSILRFMIWSKINWGLWLRGVVSFYMDLGGDVMWLGSRDIRVWVGWFEV
jgi:hypothetical protein